MGPRSWIIACDESGVHGSPHYGFGSLWLRWERRGDFIRALRDMKSHSTFKHELKWKNVQAKKDADYFKEVIGYFFQKKWLVFQCIIVRKSVVEKELFHDNDWDLARRKHFTLLLTDKMKKALKRFPEREHQFRIYVDPIASRYQKADESIGVISNNVLNQKFPGRDPVKAVITRDSKDTPSIQLCDLLLGAVMETWQKKSTNWAKNEVRKCIAEHMGWESLNSDTFMKERKFNIWYFFDPIREERRSIKTKRVNLKYPYP